MFLVELLNFSLSAMISYNVIIGDTITKIVVRIGGGKIFFIISIFHRHVNCTGIIVRNIGIQKSTQE